MIKHIKRLLGIGTTEAETLAPYKVEATVTEAAFPFPAPKPENKPERSAPATAKAKTKARKPRAKKAPKA